MIYKTSTQKKEFVKKLFTNKLMFERYVLNVHCDSDRLEIIKILSKKFIRESLKYELNFLYLKNLNNSNFSLIINLLFKEIANEWISFAQEHLAYLKDNALDEIQDKNRVLFIFSLVKDYFAKYKIEFFREIADTFLDLINTTSMNEINKHSVIIDIVSSDLLKKDGVLVIYSYQQLYSRVKDARNFRNLEISKIQLKMHELSSTKDDEKFEKLKKLLNRLEKRPIADFAEALKRVRDTMANSMLKLDTLSHFS